MKKLSMTVAVCALTVGLALTGCSATATKDKTETSAASSASTSLNVPDLPSGPHKTIADYVAENKIIESAVKRGDPGSPKFELAMPPDWRPAGKQKPEWAYGAIVYEKAKNRADPPFMTSIVSKLTGDVDTAKVLEYAPGLLENLPGYQQDGDFVRTAVSGFDAVGFQGSYLGDDDVRRYIAQKTIVVPGKDGAIYVVQLNADSPADQSDVVKAAAKVILEQSKITVE